MTRRRVVMTAPTVVFAVSGTAGMTDPADVAFVARVLDHFAAEFGEPDELIAQARPGVCAAALKWAKERGVALHSPRVVRQLDGRADKARTNALTLDRLASYPPRVSRLLITFPGNDWTTGLVASAMNRGGIPHARVTFNPKTYAWRYDLYE